MAVESCYDARLVGAVAIAPLTLGRFAIAGGSRRRVVIVDAAPGGPPLVVGESADLGVYPMALVSSGSHLYVLAENTLIKMSLEDTPVVVATYAIDCDWPYWIGYYSSHLVFANGTGGVQVVSTSGVVVSEVASGNGAIRGALTDDGLVYTYDRYGRGVLYAITANVIYPSLDLDLVDSSRGPQAVSIYEDNLVICDFARAYLYDISAGDPVLERTTEFADNTLFSVVATPGGYWVGGKEIIDELEWNRMWNTAAAYQAGYGVATVDGHRGVAHLDSTPLVYTYDAAEPTALPDGVTWTIGASAADNEWYAVTHGNGVFVAVAYTGAGNQVMTSPDGEVWTLRTCPSQGWQAVAYGNGVFVALSTDGGTQHVMTSDDDGVTWTLRTTPDLQWRGVAFGGGVFVATAITGSGSRAMTSPDGATWTLRATPQDNSWKSVTYGDGRFVAVAYDGVNRVMTSDDDGATWQLGTCPARGWLSVAYGDGLFVAVGNTGVGSRAMWSDDDGVTWTLGSTPADNDWYGVAYRSGLFVAVAYTGTGNRVMTSSRGATWAARTSAADNGWVDVAYGEGRFVAVAYTGTGNRVMTSP